MLVICCPLCCNTETPKTSVKPGWKSELCLHCALGNRGRGVHPRVRRNLWQPAQKWLPKSGERLPAETTNISQDWLGNTYTVSRGPERKMGKGVGIGWRLDFLWGLRALFEYYREILTLKLVNLGTSGLHIFLDIFQNCMEKHHGQCQPQNWFSIYSFGAKYTSDIFHS